MSHTISAVLITKNSSGTIRRCLESLQGLDHVVVHDTGSTDDTMEIARSMGADVSETRIEPFHFAKARNEAMFRSKNPWILSIDSDEILREGSIGALLDGIKNMTFAGFKVGYENRAEEGGSVSVSSKARIFRKGSWTWKYRVHERLAPLYPPAKIGEIKGCIIEHHPLGDKSWRVTQNFELLKLCVEENPEYLFASKQLGLGYVLLEQWKDAIPYLAAYVRLPENPEGPPFERAATRMQLAKCMARNGQLASSMSEFMKAAEEAPERREPLYWAVIELIKAGMPWEAVPWLEKCLSVRPWDLPEFSLNSTQLQDSLVIEEDLAFCKAERLKADQALKAMQENRR